MAIDDANRLAATAGLPGLRRKDAIAYPLGCFERLGARVERLMTDNGAASRSKLLAQATGLRPTPTHIEPHKTESRPSAPKADIDNL